MKSLVSLVRVLHMDFGMPWALVRNCVIAPTIICIIKCLVSSVGLHLLHLSSDCFILLIIRFQG